MHKGLIKGVFNEHQIFFCKFSVKFTPQMRAKTTLKRKRIGAVLFAHTSK
jgi:hypothetical protein